MLCLVEHIFSVEFPKISKALLDPIQREEMYGKFLSKEFGISPADLTTQPPVAEIQSAPPLSAEPSSWKRRVFKKILEGPTFTVVEREIAEVDSDSAEVDRDFSDKIKRHRRVEEQSEKFDKSKKVQEVEEDLALKRKSRVRRALAKRSPTQLTEEKEGDIPQRLPKKAKKPPVRRGVRLVVCLMQNVWHMAITSDNRCYVVFLTGRQGNRLRRVARN